MSTESIPDAVVPVVECLPRFLGLPPLLEQTEAMQSLAQPLAEMFVEVPGQVLALEHSEYFDRQRPVGRVHSAQVRLKY